MCNMWTHGNFSPEGYRSIAYALYRKNDGFLVEHSCWPRSSVTMASHYNAAAVTWYGHPPLPEKVA